jgi:sugar lactone lactonase YvrE
MRLFNLSLLAVAATAVISCSGAPTSVDATQSDAQGDAPPPPVAKITTIAGKNSAEPGLADGDVAVARFHSPEGIVLDASGEHLFIADSNNHTIRKLTFATNQVITIAGVAGAAGRNDTISDNGNITVARLDTPRNLVMAPDGQHVYFTDTGNFAIRQLALASGTVSTLFGKLGVAGSTDGVASDARFGKSGFGNPWGGGIAIRHDATSATMYVADSANQTIRAIDLATKQVTTIAGRPGVAGAVDGPGLTATFNKPSGLMISGTTLLVAEANNIDIRALDLVSGVVTTVAGKAPANPNHYCENISPALPLECGWIDSANGTTARFRFPFGTDSDGAGGFYVADSHNNVIRHFDAATGAVTTVAGVQATVLDDLSRASVDSAPGVAGTFSHPSHVAFRSPNVLYVADRSANCIRKVELGVR